MAIISVIVLLLLARQADSGIWGKDKAPFDFTPGDTLFIEYPDEVAQEWVAICRVDEENKIKGCWLVEWEDTKECLEDAVKRKAKPKPTPTQTPFDNKPKE